jgi:hypothetical protein
MAEFTIRSEQGRSLTFHSRVIDETGWVVSYWVTARAPGFIAELEAENPDFGVPPADLFEDIARNWQGWSGPKRWAAGEGEYSLSATSDSTGHITLVAELHAATYPRSGPSRVDRRGGGVLLRAAEGWHNLNGV